MINRTGKTQSGKTSQHTKEATAKRVYVVIELDLSIYEKDGVTETVWAPVIRGWAADGIAIGDACASIHLHLATKLPMLLVVYSGGKSLHAWFSAFDSLDRTLWPVMQYAHTLGGCTSTWSRSQFVRMPDARRAENGKRQTVHYFDPKKAVTL